MLDRKIYPLYQIADDEIPLSIGGGIGISRTLKLLLKKAHLGEVIAMVLPKVLKDMCRKKNIHVLEWPEAEGSDDYRKGVREWETRCISPRTMNWCAGR